MLKNLIGMLLVVGMLWVAYECACYIYVLLKLVRFLDMLGGKGNWMSSATFVFSVIGMIWALFMGFVIWRSRSSKKTCARKEEKRIPVSAEYPVFG